MTCEVTFVELSAFHDGELGPERRQAIARHVEGCDECQAVLHRIDGLAVVLHKAACAPLPQDLWPALEIAARDLTRPLSVPSLVRRAAAAILGFTLPFAAAVLADRLCASHSPAAKDELGHALALVARSSLADAREPALEARLEMRLLASLAEAKESR